MASMTALAWLDATLYDALPYGIVTLSLVVTFKYLRFPDVTVSASFVLGSAISAIAIVQWQAPPAVAVIIAFLAGAGAGVVTAFIHVRLKVEPIVASIISAFAVYAVNQSLLRPTIPYGSQPTILSWAERIDRDISFGNIPWHPAQIIVFVAIVLFAKFALDWLLDSEAGLALRALEDPDAGEAVLARLGVSPGAIKTMGLSLGNGLVGLSGALIGMKEGSANLNRGLDILITGLIAYLLGQALLGRRRGYRDAHATVAAILGALAYFALVGVSYRIGVPTEFTRIVLAALVAIAVGRVEWRRRGVEARNNGRHDEGGQTNAVQDISYAYPSSDLPVLHHLSAEFPGAAITQITGSNGTGKTTLLRILAGQLGPVSTGRILIDGRDLTDEPRLTRVRYVDQNPARSVVKTMRVREFLSLCMLRGRPSPFRRAITTQRQAELRSALVAHGFPEALLAKHASRLSGGETQLVNLLAFLVERRPPGLVLLDEPLNGLDRNNRQRVKELLKALRSSGTSIVLVSHDTDALDTDRVIDLDALRHQSIGSRV
jgi:putative tryptophan/tyrosine transport system permease protein